ncbi:MAG: hypothetical protein AB7O98_04255 [Hyphomonadaceae bacterium]
MAIARGRGLEVMVIDAVKSYFKFVDDFQSRHQIPIVIWAPPPSRPAERTGTFRTDLPFACSPIERNYATALFTEHLRRFAAARDRVEVVSILDLALRPDFTTQPDALFDQCHLDNRFMPMAIDRLGVALARLGIEDLEACFQRQWPITGDAAREIKLLSSRRLNAKRDDPKGALTFDLICAYPLSRVQVGGGNFKKLRAGINPADLKVLHEGDDISEFRFKRSGPYRLVELTPASPMSDPEIFCWTFANPSALP